MLKKALETNADIVYCDIFEEFEKNKIVMPNKLLDEDLENKIKQLEQRGEENKD